MKKHLFAILVTILSLACADTADAQRRGRPHTPMEIERTVERARATGIAARVDAMRRSVRSFLASTTLTPTPENFARAQVAMGYLNLSEPRRSGVGAIAVPSLTTGRTRLNYFEALVAKESDTEVTITDLTPGIAIFDGVPKNPDQFSARFGRPMTASDQQDIAAYRQVLSREGAYRANSLTDAFNRPERLMLIIAHNENGRIVNGEGQSRGIGEVANRCAQLIKLCIFLVCESHEAVGTDAIGLTRKINVRRASALTAELTDIVAAAPRDENGNLRLPLHTVHAMLRRVDLEGGALRLVGYRTADWVVVRMIVIIPRCDNQRCP